jgi:hypothetical protein
MATTYDPISTTILGSAATTIDLTSIPSTYTDLKLVFVCTTSTPGNARFRFNSDTGSNYSYIALGGDGTTASSFLAPTSSFYFTAFGSTSSTIPHFYSVDIFSYAGSTYKTLLLTESSDDNGSGSTALSVQLWRNTSAVTSINIFGGTFSIGTTATLYGIKNA